MKSSKIYQLHKSSETSVIWVCLKHYKNMQKGLEIVSKKKKKRIEKEYPGGFLTVEYNKTEFGKYYTEI